LGAHNCGHGCISDRKQEAGVAVIACLRSSPTTLITLLKFGHRYQTIILWILPIKYRSFNDGTTIKMKIISGAVVHVASAISPS
jgi:hypothetical protein